MCERVFWLCLLTWLTATSTKLEKTDTDVFPGQNWPDRQKQTNNKIWKWHVNSQDEQLVTRRRRRTWKKHLVIMKRCAICHNVVGGVYWLQFLIGVGKIFNFHFAAFWKFSLSVFQTSIILFKPPFCLLLEMSPAWSIWSRLLLFIILSFMKVFHNEAGVCELRRDCCTSKTWRHKLLLELGRNDISWYNSRMTPPTMLEGPGR